jgi:competence ComEA-like helix-hairpin-helix protein
MDRTRRELFTKSELRAVLFLAALLLIGGAVVIYQKSQAVICPEVIITEVESAASTEGRGQLSSGAVTAEMLTRYKININTAPADSLELLPGIGPHLAQRIVEHRKQSGRFDRVDDLADVKGIGPTKLRAVRDMIAVDDQ